jgi:hypothetical protein
VLVIERHHGDHASAVIVIGQQLNPIIMPHASSPDESASPVIAALFTILV